MRTLHYITTACLVTPEQVTYCWTPLFRRYTLSHRWLNTDVIVWAHLASESVCTPVYVFTERCQERKAYSLSRSAPSVPHEPLRHTSWQPLSLTFCLSPWSYNSTFKLGLSVSLNTHLIPHFPFSPFVPPVRHLLQVFSEFHCSFLIRSPLCLTQFC